MRDYFSLKENADYGKSEMMKTNTWPGYGSTTNDFLDMNLVMIVFGTCQFTGSYKLKNTLANTGCSHPLTIMEDIKEDSSVSGQYLYMTPARCNYLCKTHSSGNCGEFEFLRE